MNDADAAHTQARLRLAAEEGAPEKGAAHVESTGGASLPADHTQAILETTKRVATVLKAAGLPFALTGSVAAYAHGVPGSLQHDTDFCVRREDGEAVLAALADDGVQAVPAPEDWLVKARAGGEDIDLIFELGRRPVTTELLQSAPVLPVDSVRMPVLPPTELLSTLLSALTEQHCDLGALLPLARTLRERIDWDRIRAHYHAEPLPDAFLYLLERLGVIAPREVAS
ncbi:nucleotidyltransferase family protein [Streptomyces sp. PA03-1a]|nr:nucleotidyltransferase family protein [Streptomyces sp. PA03-1a]MDX2819286.1 nucleotidyltransferase family protein [Streptomyces sp. PA03-5A]